MYKAKTARKQAPSFNVVRKPNSPHPDLFNRRRVKQLVDGFVPSKIAIRQHVTATYAARELGIAKKTALDFLHELVNTHPEEYEMIELSETDSIAAKNGRKYGFRRKEHA